VTRPQLRRVWGGRNRSSGGSSGGKTEPQASFGVGLGRKKSQWFLVCTSSQDHKTQQKTKKNNGKLKYLKNRKKKSGKIVGGLGGY